MPQVITILAFASSEPICIAVCLAAAAGGVPLSASNAIHRSLDLLPGAEPVLDGVGCYRLETMGAQLFARVEGDYFSILGLPLQPLLAELRLKGVIAS